MLFVFAVLLVLRFILFFFMHGFEIYSSAALSSLYYTDAIKLLIVPMSY